MFNIHLSESMTEQIDFSYNLLMTTDGFSRYLILHTLDLSTNKITQFYQLPQSIIILDLSHNKLGKVFEDYAMTLKSKGTRQETKTMFTNLINLVEINLSHNEIKIAPSSVFEHNKELKVYLQYLCKTINISNNLLRRNTWCFKLLTKLINVDLSNNQISSHHDLKGLDKIPSLQKLTVSNNPFETLFQNLEEISKKLRLQLPTIPEIFTNFGQVVVIEHQQTPRKIVRCSSSQQNFQVNFQQIEDEDSMIPGVSNTRKTQHSSKLSTDSSKNKTLIDKQVTPFTSVGNEQFYMSFEQIKAQEVVKQQISGYVVPANHCKKGLKSKTPTKKPSKTNQISPQLTLTPRMNKLSNKEQVNRIKNVFSSRTKSTEKYQVKQQCPTVVVQQFLVEQPIDVDIFQNQSLMDYLTPEKQGSTYTDDELKLSTIYKDLLKQNRQLNCQLKSRKQSLMQIERENNQHKFGKQLLREILKQAFICEDTQEQGKFTILMDKIQDDLMNFNFTTSQRNDYIQEIKLKLLSLEKNSNLKQSIQNIQHIEELIN